MKKLVVHNESDLNYVVRGKGRAVVLLHGFAEDGSIWDEIAASLENNYRLLIPDLPGTGYSALSSPLSIESMAEAVKAMIEEEQISEAVIIGHSMGGYIGLAFAEYYPSVVSALGLFHSSAFADDEEKIAVRQKNISFIRSHGTLAFLKQATPTLFSESVKKQRPELVEALIQRYKDLDPEALAAYQQAMIERPERLHILENIVKPVLMIIGREDKAIPYDLSLKQSHLPSVAYIHILENSGHMGMQEEFEKSRKILEDFLADLS